jgi:hypothetical protein
LLDVGEEEVVDEKEELIWWIVRAALQSPSNQTPGQEEEERGRAEEGQETEGRHRDQAVRENLRQWRQRLGCEIKRHGGMNWLEVEKRINICGIECKGVLREYSGYMEVRLLCGVDRVVHATMWVKMGQNANRRGGARFRQGSSKLEQSSRTVAP